MASQASSGNKTKSCLVISDIEARNLGVDASKEHKRKEDKSKEQYVTVTLKGKREKTNDPGTWGAVEDDDSKLCTKWKERLEFDLAKDELQRGDFVKIKIFQSALFLDKLLGKTELPVTDVINRRGQKVDFEVNLRNGNGNPLEAILKCSLLHICPEAATEKQVTSNAPIPVKDTVNTELPLLEKREQVVKDLHKTIHFAEKPRDFEVRIKVIEARHIVGRNISPVVRVTVGEIKKQTRVKHTTNQPFFNQTFSFIFNTKFQELFEQDIKFEVFDSRRLRFNSLIGFYKCDVREVYNFEGHTVLRKWIVLAEPQESKKIIQGETVTTKNHQPQGVGGEAVSLDNLAGSLEEDDIESNLLHLPGVSLSPAVFSLKVYKAVDIPQMDHESLLNRLRRNRKDCADPYCIFSFAGKQVTSSIKYDSRSPQFNEKLNIPFKYPSVCDKIKIQLMDWDFGTLDDYIGTIYLPVSQLSGQGGNEYLPTFGPCFINMYGSPREYSDWPNKHEDLDKGIGEGAAYRGRVLVELETKKSAANELQVEVVGATDIIRVQPFMRTKKFRLLAVFLEATMLAIKDAQVEFELSIGNYGNKLDDSVSPRPSSTTPTNPVFDGEKYHYLPWGNSKPYVRIDCEWEDICFRLGALNKLLRICKDLEQSINRANRLKSTASEERDDFEKFENCVRETLDRLIVNCRFFPKLDPKKFKLTKLDQQMNETRLEVLNSIAAECEELQSKNDKSLIIPNLEDLLNRIRMIAVEPQNSIPDVIIWMIKAERERVAYCRIPANELLYCEDESECGVNCGKTIDVSLKPLGRQGPVVRCPFSLIARFPGRQDSTHKSKFAGMLRLMIWFGREEHRGQWDELERTGGIRTMYAETYENQTFYGQWSSRNLSRPAFSNANGTLSLPKDEFKAPEGWHFVGEWEVYSELSTQFRKDNGCKTFIEDVFENEYRFIPGGVWKKNDPQAWTDRFGNLILDKHDQPIKDKDDIKPPPGWKWSQREWTVDPDRATDSNGWEYTVEASYGQTDYEAAEKTFHFCRRRRWMKQRKIDANAKVSLDLLPRDKEGWEYAMTFKSKFHAQEKPLYNVRRKRLRKQLMGKMSAADPVFILKAKGKHKNEEAVLVPPSIFLSFKEPIICQLRAHLFQGRNLLPSDSDGLADPFVRLSFGCRSATSKTINKKLNPTWDQMLVLESVPVYGHPDQVIENPPDVVMELFDLDRNEKCEYLGRVQVEPLVLQDDSGTLKTRLSWYGVYKGSSRCGDVLAAFELFLNERESAPPLPAPDNNEWFPIPRHIRPETQRTAVEVLCWGLRNLRRFHWMKVRSPSVMIEIANETKKKSVVDGVNENSNFEGDRVLCFDVNLPREAIYLPAITIQLKSSRSQSPIGICVVENLRKFQRKRKDDDIFDQMFEDYEKRFFSYVSDSEALTVRVDSGSESSQQSQTSKSSKTSDKEKEKKVKKKDKAVDWWGRYFAAKLDKNKYPKIYSRSLEEEFNHFQDHIQTFYFRRGKMDTSDEDDENSIVGEFKGALAIYDLHDDSSESLRPKVFNENRLHRLDSVPCIVRVYVVKAYDLKPKDKNGLSDPYIVASLGDEVFDNKKNYEADTLEAEFGQVFQFHAVIPEAKDLKVQVVDNDYGNDDLIGETVVDLEDRLLTRRHATAGLQRTYDKKGPSKWRLGSKYTPSVILKRHCEEFGIECTLADGNNSNLRLTHGKINRYYKLSDFEDENTDLTNAGESLERLSLHILMNALKTNYELIPEHVETRDLTNKLYPGFSQGKLEMFVDILPEMYGPPEPPIDISPRKPKHYELRVIVWNTKDVRPQETNIYGDEMSDIFVKCTMTGIDDVQKTDTHFRSLNGDGMFNYRMVFPFQYSETKRRVIVMKKANFLSRRKHSEEIQPQLVVEILDNDLFSFNDFIGKVELNLKKIAKPYGKSEDIKDWPLSKKTNSLFEKRRVRGWWPVAGKPKKKDQEEDEGKTTNSLLERIWARCCCPVAEKPKKKDEKGVPKSDKLVLTGKVELTLELVEEEDAKARPAGKGQDKPNQHPVLEKPQRPATSFLWILNPWKSFRYIIWSHFKWYFVLIIILALIVLLIALFIYSAPGYSVKKLFNA